MSDIGLQVIFDEVSGRSFIDINIGEADLEADEGAETAALISLFTDQRCTTEEVPTFETARRGWWGDLLADVNDDQIGSKLWLLTREKTTTQTLQRFIDYSRDALQWMIDDGFADEVNVDAEYIARGIIKVTIEMVKPSGLSESFELIWDGQGGRR